YNGFGKVFDKNYLGNSDKLAATIREVLENKKYGENARRISHMLAKKPFSSREKLIKTVEFAAEFGPFSALRPQSLDMNFIEYNNIDIITAGFTVTAVVVLFLYKSIGFALRKCLASKS
ncbi:hypothetical protein PENTCL1PPCAC_7226, partial [Pristionchus entomophagus]